VTTICRYVLTLVGVAFSCRIVGITWASVQWLVAAMTVGLGFGLQEIFANFVSGLILLIERPLRVGDLVTVGSVTGTVSKMHIRATTVSDFDRRELVVPNKKFITDEFVNWTLSDPITRVVLPVGIAYGSETNRAHGLLLKVAEEHPLVLADPAPSAMFSGFGDSTLDFQLRVFIPTRDTYPIVVHELNMAIDREFAKAEIEIAFPQRDINVRSIEGLAQLLPTIGRHGQTENKAA
jgi:potassium efflux system protein